MEPHRLCGGGTCRGVGGLGGLSGLSATDPTRSNDARAVTFDSASTSVLVIRDLFHHQSTCTCAVRDMTTLDISG